MKVLIVENEQSLSQAILRYLKKESCVCELADTYAKAFRKANNFDYDCAIISLNLPGGNGMALVREFRRGNKQAGIIIISARASVEERVKGLEEGADDFLLKPFHLSELNARVKAVLRRKTGEFAQSMAFGGLSIKLDEHAASVDGVSLKLTKKEFEILLYLARNKNRVVTKESIAEHLWGDHMDDAPSFDFIYAHLKNLRKKLEAYGYRGCLKTIYGIGYKFEKS